MSSIRKSLPAGIVDAGFASLATFASGLVAVNVLDDVTRGIYAVFFTAFVLGQIIAYQLIYVPAEVVAVGRPVDRRLVSFFSGLRPGLVAAFLGSTVIVAAFAFASGLTTPDVTVPLMVSALVATFLSPTQDHVRRMFHIARLPWHAAAVSAIQFAVTTAMLGFLLAVGVPVVWVPFGALAVANAVSLAVGSILVRRRVSRLARERLRFRSLARSGRWLLLQAAIPAGANFVAAGIITTLAGAVAMGHAEAARVVAQPILVLATGLTFALRPRVMEAAIRRDRATARRTGRVLLAGTTLVGVGYLLVVAVPWFGNPMRLIAPAAYVVPGLVAATILANLVLASLFLATEELAAADRAVTLTRVSAVAAPIQLAVTATAAWTGAFARPLGLGAGSLGRLVGYHRALNEVYGSADREVVAG